jgi:hypothetical protein
MNKLLTREEWLTYLDTTWKKCLHEAWDDMNREYIIAAQQFEGELYVKASDHHKAVRAAVAAERKRIADIIRSDKYGIGNMCSQWTSDDVADDILEEQS